jgi:hypothetical protein
MIQDSVPTFNTDDVVLISKTQHEYFKSVERLLVWFANEEFANEDLTEDQDNTIELAKKNVSAEETN